jgi:hypothetical protein
MTTNKTTDVGRGVYERVTDSTGTTYLLQAVPSGHLGSSVHVPQGPVEALIQTVGVRIVNRVFFRGGWTLLAWRSDVYAPKRERVHKERFAGRAEALAAFDRLAATIRRSGR